MKKYSIGNRMKENYENRYRFQLTRRTPVIIRLDGKAFHTFTKGLEKPFDLTLQTV
jgi:tRNA(His) guanylyltransferase